MSSVSIIIPNYNGSRFLREAIDSALVQESVDCEVIVVDDGSTDDSVEIIRSCGQQIHGVFQPNQGACVARNAGLAIAKGKFVKFLDADDTLLPNSVFEQLKQFNELASQSDRVIVYGNALLVDAEGGVLRKNYVDSLLDGRQATGDDMIRNSPLVSMPLYPTDALRSIGGFRPEMPSAQEYDLNLRLFFSGWSFVFKHTLCFAYRQHCEGVRISTKRPSAASFEKRYAAYENHLEMAEEYYDRQIPQSIQSAFAGAFWATGRRALRCYKREQAMHYFSKAYELAAVPYADGNQAYRWICWATGPVFAERVAGWRSKWGKAG